MRAAFEQIEKFIKKHKRILIISGISILSCALLVIILTAISHSEDSDIVEASIAAEKTTEETMDVRVSVVRNGVQAGKFVDDDSETNLEAQLPYKKPRAVGEGEVQEAIAARAAAKAKAKEEEKKLEEEKKAAELEEEQKKEKDKDTVKEVKEEENSEGEESETTSSESESTSENTSAED